MYGQSIIKGQEGNAAVREVFDFLIHDFTYENCERYFPEKLFVDIDYTVENYPNPIVYADMSGDTMEEKNRLLDLWVH
jgi:iron(III) transport system substrate-binding protein